MRMPMKEDCRESIQAATKKKERCEYITAQPPYLFYFFFSYNPLFLVDWHMQTS